MTADLVAAAADRLAQLAPEGAPVLLAVSGGPDSVAMLDLLWRGRDRHRRSLVVAHVDHGIAARSGEVAGAVRSLAGERGLPFHLRQLELGPACGETVARRERRAALRVIQREAGASCIATAHHADDQVETVLLRVLRGSGPAGLAAMAPRRGPWIRPLLEVARDALRGHLAACGLSAWQDPANRDPRHLRSWLRIAVLPLLEERLPDLRERLGDVASQAAGNRRAWNAIPALLDRLELAGEPQRVSVAAAPLRGYRSEVQHAVLAALGRRFGVPLGRRQLARVQALLESGQSGRRVRLAPGLEAEMAFDRLIMRRPEDAPFAPAVLPTEGELVLGRHRFRCRVGPGGPPPDRRGAVIGLEPGRYSARPWQAGDRIRPLGGTGSRSVAVLLREARVAAADRPGWPVVLAEDATIVWVPGICRSGDRVPAADKEALHVECDLA